MGVKQTLLNYVTDELYSRLSAVPDDFFAGAEEIRLRAGKPLLITHRGGEYILTACGPRRTEGRAIGGTAEVFCPTAAHIGKCLELMSNYSLYAFEEELKNGYITLPGGHRAGITGKAVTEGGRVKTLKNINGLNIRISREVKGCADAVMPRLIAGGKPCHTMILSPPGGGKTTLLRDIVRSFSNGVEGLIDGQSVAIADERSEIAGCYRGIPQNDVGVRTDVLDAVPKAEGMMMLLRSMSPKIIAVDEIGHGKDIDAIEEVINAGIALICTVHGRSLEEIGKRETLAALLAKGIFTRFVVLARPGVVETVKAVGGARAAAVRPVFGCTDTADTVGEARAAAGRPVSGRTDTADERGGVRPCG